MGSAALLNIGGRMGQSGTSRQDAGSAGVYTTPSAHGVAKDYHADASARPEAAKNQSCASKHELYNGEMRGAL